MDRKTALEVLETEFLTRYAARAEKGNYFDATLYEKYNVKRGLRNADGSGVVVGLTEIGEVHGYYYENGVKKPVEGGLRYRGYDVRDLVLAGLNEDRFVFEEVVFLLLFNALPTKSELHDFTKLLGSLRPLPNNFKEDVIFRFPSTNIMNLLARSVLFNYAFDDNPEDNSVKNVLRQSVELIARLPVMAAYAYHAMVHYIKMSNLNLTRPDPELSTAENILHQMRGKDNYTRLEAMLLDLALVLHAEHGGGNNSTFSLRLVTSALTDTYSAIAAALCSLKGYRHGGANIKVREMVKNIKQHVPKYQDPGALKDYLVKIVKKAANDGTGLIYGLGHAVYTLSDPRAELLRERARELASEKNRMDEFEFYHNIEIIGKQVLVEVKGMSEHEICANVDLYSGFVYDMLNIPEELYTPLFAISRISGWCAHRIEEIVSGGRIIRPAYKAVMPDVSYVPLTQRS
jgi:citrate synthase